MKRAIKSVFLFSVLAAAAGLGTRILWYYCMIKNYNPEGFIFGFGIILLSAGFGIAGMWHKLKPGTPSNPDKALPVSGFSDTYGLSKAETAILEMLAGGLKNAEIAEARHVSLNTVKTHLSHIYQKTGVRHRTQLLAMIRNENNQNHPKE